MSSTQFSLRSVVHMLSLCCLVLCAVGYAYRIGKEYFAHESELYQKLGRVTAHFEVPWRTTPTTFVSSVQAILDAHRIAWDSLPEIATNTDCVCEDDLRQHPDYHYFVLRFLSQVTRDYVKHVHKSRGDFDLRHVERLIDLLDELEYDRLCAEHKNRYFEVQGRLDQLVYAISERLIYGNVNERVRADQFSLYRDRLPNLVDLELPNALAQVHLIRELEKLEEQLGHKWRRTTAGNEFLRSEAFGARLRDALDRLPDLNWPPHSLSEHEEMALELRKRYLIPPVVN